MSINDITQAAQRLNEAADAYHGKIADINARIAAKEAEVDNFLSAADSTFLKRFVESHSVVSVPGDSEHYYPVIFETTQSINQFIIRRNVSADDEIYGSFNGSLLFKAVYQHDSDGVYPRALDVAWHRMVSYSPNIPSTPQFIAKILVAHKIRENPAHTQKPCIWLRGNTTYRMGATFPGFLTCNGDGIINGRDYGILASDYAPLIEFTPETPVAPAV